MKLLLLGSTGNTGQHLTEQALAQGHEVTVLVRSPEKIRINHPGLQIVKGDVLDPDIIRQVLEGKDAVISALGLGGSFKSNNFVTNAVRVLIPAMEAKGVKRLIFTSAFGVGKTHEQSNFFQRLFFRFLLRDVYADKAMADDLIMKSSLHWTIVHPVMMTNGDRKNKIRHGEKLPMNGMPVITRADTAAFLLTQLRDDTYLRKSPVVMND